MGKEIKIGSKRIEFHQSYCGMLVFTFSPIQDGEQKDPHTSFSPVTSTNVGISP